MTHQEFVKIWTEVEEAFADEKRRLCAKWQADLYDENGRKVSRSRVDKALCDELFDTIGRLREAVNKVLTPTYKFFPEEAVGLPQEATRKEKER